MPAEVPNTQGPEAPSPMPDARPGGLVGRARRATAWAAANRVKAGLMAGATLVSAGGVVVLWLALAATGGNSARSVTLETALAALDRGDYAVAQELAETLRKQKTLPPDEFGGPVFVLGAAAAYDARQVWTKQRPSRYLLAARYLEEARDRGFPPGRKAEGLFLLGESLYRSGQIPACRPVLKEALPLSRTRKSQIHDLLAAAYLEDANPKLPEALEHNTRYLSDRLLSRAQRERGLLRQAQILLRVGRLAECRKTLKEISPDAGNHAGAIVVEGRLLMQEAQDLTAGPDVPEEARLQARRRYEEAIKVLRAARGQDTLSTQATRKAQYLIGVCLLETDDFRAALAQFDRIRVIYPATPEAMAAGFRQAEMARRMGRDAEALAGYRRALATVADPNSYSNPWISLDELQTESLAAYEHYMKTGSFAVALQLVQQFYPLFSRVKKTQWTAETCRTWGHALLAKSDQLAPDESELMRRQGRAQLRRAGRAYEELANLETTTRRYTDHLWSSAENYLAGHDYQDAVKVLKEYLKNETRRRHSRALVNLGEALLALDRVDDALAALRDCVDFHPTDAAAFRARLLASRAYLEKGDVVKAEDLLQDNLDGTLSPSSKEWRESLFAMGRLLYINGQYDKAVARLGEAVQRYPAAPETLEARYLIADSHRRGAEALQEKLESSQVPNARQVRTRQICESLEKALTQYKKIQETLGQRQQISTLTALERSILRNSNFAAGDVQFDLGRYQEAVQTYTTAAYRYQSDPAVLLAYLQIAHAQQRMNKPADARNTLKQAKVVLSRIKLDTPFDTYTPYSRKEWEQLLDTRLNDL